MEINISTNLLFGFELNYVINEIKWRNRSTIKYSRINLKSTQCIVYLFKLEVKL